MLKTTVRIIATLRWPGLHSWPDAPNGYQVYLANRHRHEFHITAKKVVKHNDRDVEFIHLKRLMLDYLRHLYPDGDMGSQSCEDLAQRLYLRFQLSYCSVMEDGENGAEIF